MIDLFDPDQVGFDQLFSGERIVLEGIYYV